MTAKPHEFVEVTPRAGVWIETPTMQGISHPPHVTPRAGVWIETGWFITSDNYKLSLPVRECGLKLVGVLIGLE